MNYVPINIDKANLDNGMFTIGEQTFSSQCGVNGNNRAHNKKLNNLYRFSATFKNVVIREFGGQNIHKFSKTRGRIHRSKLNHQNPQ